MRVSVSSSCFKGGCGNMFSVSDSSFFYVFFFRTAFKISLPPVMKAKKKKLKLAV